MGAAKFLETLTDNYPVQVIPDYVKIKLLKNAVMSDCPETVRIVLRFTNAVTREIVNLAEDRKNSEIIQQIKESPRSQQILNKEKKDLAEKIINKRANLFNKIPRTEEFTYQKKLDKTIPLFSINNKVGFPKILKKLKIPPIHVGIKDIKKNREEEWQTCPNDCGQKRSCERIREVYTLVNMIMQELEKEKHGYFRGIKITIIGSVREGSRVFFSDEVDLHLSLHDSFKNYTYFDSFNQCLMFNQNGVENINDIYIDSETKAFKCNNYFIDFINSVYDIIHQQKIQLPSHFSMKPLTTDYTPCQVCMEYQYGELLAFRCQHTPECTAHKSRKEVCNCNCRQFRYPSMSYSKIGAALHLEFQEEDGTTFNIDCDLNVPTVPCGTEYDGDIRPIEEYLQREKPVNWVEEESKLESMMDIAAWSNVGKDNWQVKFRMINNNTVLPRQVRVLLLS